MKLKRHMHGELPGPIHGELIKPDELESVLFTLRGGAE